MPPAKGRCRRSESGGNEYPECRPGPRSDDAVDLQAVTGLECADALLGLGAEDAVGRAREADGHQGLLQPHDVGPLGPQPKNGHLSWTRTLTGLVTGAGQGAPRGRPDDAVGL